MSERCCAPAPVQDTRFRRVLWIALVVNAAMFLTELVSGLGARSTALLADAVDFFGDAANYAVSLLVLPLGALWRARAALLKALSMACFGIGVLAYTAYNLFRGNVPEPMTMGVVGAVALCANAGVAMLLYRFRADDSNARSVWLCSRNDAVGNVAVMLAALGVFGSGSGWPDVIVAGVMATLALASASSVTVQARRELQLIRT